MLPSFLVGSSLGGWPVDQRVRARLEVKWLASLHNCTHGPDHAQRRRNFAAQGSPDDCDTFNDAAYDGEYIPLASMSAPLRLAVPRCVSMPWPVSDASSVGCVFVRSNFRSVVDQASDSQRPSSGRDRWRRPSPMPRMTACFPFAASRGLPGPCRPLSSRIRAIVLVA